MLAPLLGLDGAFKTLTSIRSRELCRGRCRWPARVSHGMWRRCFADLSLRRRARDRQRSRPSMVETALAARDSGSHRLRVEAASVAQVRENLEVLTCMGCRHARPGATISVSQTRRPGPRVLSTINRNFRRHDGHRRANSRNLCPAARTNTTACSSVGNRALCAAEGLESRNRGPQYDTIRGNDRSDANPSVNYLVHHARSAHERHQGSAVPDRRNLARHCLDMNAR